MALEFSTGAESVWTSRIETLRVSRNASDVTALLREGPNYILRMQNALQRVENICYDTEEMWYFPILFNMTSENQHQKLGKAARCYKNYSTPIDAKKFLRKSGFSANDVAGTMMWSDSQLFIGHDENEDEVTVPYTTAKDVRIGSLEFYSFLAAEFKGNKRPLNGSERALSGISSSKRTPIALYTAQYRVARGKSIECLVRMKWRKEKKTDVLKRQPPEVDVCLIPISGNRGVLGYFSRNQLVMSVALDRASSFHDLKVLRATPWVIGGISGLYTFRELAILTIISRQMVQAINMDGYEDVKLEVGDKHLTVPTWTVWGILLFAFCLLVLVLAKASVTLLRRQLKVRGNLGTARGVAEHWLLRNEESEPDFVSGGGVILVADNGLEDGWTGVTVKRDLGLKQTRESW
ncbi:hypothetical protein FGB62_154g120 [Gracilaria domingensis]|nr:hypothetical protein FGB62_154g120 [Gracilaria domingensis]